MINKQDIKKYIPHREPFLFVDKVVKLEICSSIIAVKEFGPDQDFFRGHFPGNPVVPGVIIIEALAQTGGILVYASYSDEIGEQGNFDVYLMGLDKVKFRKPVYPGNVVNLQVEILKKRSRIVKLRGEATVGEDRVAEADILATFIN